jgi:hypothetical protein
MTCETLLTLAHAAEWMAEASEASDRNGRCTAHLYRAAREARAQAAAVGPSDTPSGVDLPPNPESALGDVPA